MSRVAIVIANLPWATPRGSYKVNVMVGSKCIGSVAMYGWRERDASPSVAKRPTLTLMHDVLDIDATCAVLDVPPQESVAAQLAALKTALEGPRVTYRVCYGPEDDVSEPLDTLPCRRGMRPKATVHVYDRVSVMPTCLVTGIYHLTGGAEEDGFALGCHYTPVAAAVAELRSTVRLLTRSCGHAYSGTGVFVQLPSSVLRLRDGEAVSALLCNRDLFQSGESFPSVDVTACGGSVEVQDPAFASVKTTGFGLLLTTTRLPGAVAVAVDAADGTPEDTPSRVGTPVWMVGFPRNLSAHVARGTVTTWPPEFDVFEHSIPHVDGMTGAAIFSDAGIIIGVHFTDTYAVKWSCVAARILACAEKINRGDILLPGRTRVVVHAPATRLDAHRRRSISAVLADAHQGPLLLWALLEMQRRDSKSDPLSFFQLAAMHCSLPTPWDGVRRPYVGDGDGDADGGRFCVMETPEYLPWLRGYLRLFEQALVDTAVRGATDPDNALFCGDGRFVEAAAALRLPFWDALQCPMPAAFTQEHVAMGLAAPIKSPFVSFTPPHGAWAGVPTTRRVASDAQPVTAVTAARVARFLQSTYEADDALNLLHKIHLDVCTRVGGTFENAEAAAFDPAFVLHLCNMERLHAQWQSRHGDQALYPPELLADVRDNKALPFRCAVAGKHDIFWTLWQLFSPKVFGTQYEDA